ncbi:transposase, partial [Saccharicrinis fermentans]
MFLPETSIKIFYLRILGYCQKHKGMEMYAWCIMSNHMHLIFRSTDG